MNDHELDAALRMLTAVDADPAVADRVLRAIDDDRPGHALPVSWLAAAAVVLAVVAGGTWYAAHPLSLPGIPTTVPLAQTRPLQLPSYDHAARGTSSPVGVPVTAVPARHATRRTLRETDLPWPPRIPALEHSEPLAIAPIERSRIGAPPLGIQPLSISQLEIASLER